ncbi:hypothetical protein BH24BAC1_BH24BAC1_13370 [soil metagenome]
MKEKIQKILLVAGVLLAMAHLPAKAQNSDQRTSLSVYASGLQYHGTLGSEFWNLGSTRIGGGLSLNRYLTRGLDAGLHLNYGRLDYSGNWGNLGLNNPLSFDSRVLTGTLGLKAKLNNGWILKEEARIAPYLMAGAGWIRANTEGMRPSGNATTPRASFEESFTSFGVYGGAGITVWLTDNIDVFLQTGQHYPTKDGLDGIPQDNPPRNDRFLQHQLGITFKLGKPRDTDGDGVPDRKDECPDTPAGVQVDERGCPIDSDGDGVPDYQDQCPDTPAGVQVDARGCPVDTDADGIPDYQDDCPDTPASVRVDARGCPIDSDGDGVPDYLDLCPNSPGTLENRGCPEIDDDTRRLIEEKVQFEFDRANVQEGYKLLLDSIIIALGKYPDHVLLIKGHTDHIGTEEYNQALSERRAEAVKEYLIQNGVQNPERLVTRGYGKSQPLVEVNETLPKRRTERERAQNRRVGFELNTPDMQINLP